MSDKLDSLDAEKDIQDLLMHGAAVEIHRNSHRTLVCVYAMTMGWKANGNNEITRQSANTYPNAVRKAFDAAMERRT